MEYQPLLHISCLADVNFTLGILEYIDSEHNLKSELEAMRAILLFSRTLRPDGHRKPSLLRYSPILASSVGIEPTSES